MGIDPFEMALPLFRQPFAPYLLTWRAGAAVHPQGHTDAAERGRRSAMMTEVSGAGAVFVCEICGWHTTDRPAAVWHAMKAHKRPHWGLSEGARTSASAHIESPSEGGLSAF